MERIAEAAPEKLAEQSRISPTFWRIADLFVMAIWSLVTAFTLLHHEKWSDEAQGWLLARDLDLPTLWFKELRYEGSPGLWHSLLWLAQRLFHIPYAGLGAIGLLCAAAGVGLMLLRAPFPRYVRWLLSFSYFMVYQYAVIARPYVLLPLLAFAAAMLFKDVKHPERITVVLALLANLSIHGILLAACIGLAYLWQAKLGWASLDGRVRGRYALSVGAMILVLLFLCVVLNPPSDAEGLHDVQARTLPAIGLAMWQGVNGAFFDFAPLTVVWLTLLGAWCFHRKGSNAILLPVLIVVQTIFYGFYGWTHHQGTIFIAAIMGLWIAWPTTEEKKQFSTEGQWTHKALVAGLVCLLGYQAWCAGSVIWNDYRYPYSGAEDAAKYLKSVGADKRPIMGFRYSMVAVEGYFDHNIQANRPTAYFHHGAVTVQDIDRDFQRYTPDYVVFPCWANCEAEFQNVYEPSMRSIGYSLAHHSEGYLLSKRGWEMRQDYYIYHRN